MENTARTGAEKPSLSLSDIVVKLTQSWSDGPDARSWPTPWVGYTLSSTAGLREGPAVAGWRPMLAEAEIAARAAFDLWDDLIAVDLVDVGASPYPDISVNASSSAADAIYSRVWTRASDDSISHAEVWFDSDAAAVDSGADFSLGRFGRTALLHETGHALGLSHPGHYEGRVNYADAAEYAQDTRQYAVMSYFTAGANGNNADHRTDSGRMIYAATPLLHDIVAIQALYGADMTTRADNTVYGFNSTADRDAFDFSVNPAPVVAIWDAGGIDTLDLSGSDQRAVIDLNEGAFSSVGGLSQNLAIAYGTEIENAIGGAGNDRISGNDLDNLLRGGAGHDRLFGGEGADRFDLIAASGHDQVEDFSAGDLLLLDRAEARLGRAQVTEDGIRLTYSGGSVTLHDIDLTDLTVLDQSTIAFRHGSGDDPMPVAASLAEIDLDPVEGGFALHVGGTVGHIGPEVTTLALSDATLSLDRSPEAANIYLFYEAVLDRDPRPQGLAFWTNVHRAGMSLEEVAQFFLDSPEFLSRFGDGPDNAAFVDSLFFNVFDRAPKEQGATFWTTHLDNGFARSSLVAAFVVSDEMRRIYDNEIDDGVWLLV